MPGSGMDLRSLLEHFGISLKRQNALSFWFDAFFFTQGGIHFA
ncbi:hypothetical protein FHS81_002091 [Pseudochelatococcus contaminans]|uniref:Uncharacterized protein n=1 Tax=Pseudochelatococcus contaminans TaxID=1538103 RepID=A0A7W6EHD1_9HYPH|nr:hypothetical protein [Pseudochelatococcus contaminans]